MLDHWRHNSIINCSNKDQSNLAEGDTIRLIMTFGTSHSRLVSMWRIGPEGAVWAQCTNVTDRQTDRPRNGNFSNNRRNDFQRCRVIIGNCFCLCWCEVSVIICVDQKTKVNNMKEIDLVPDIDNTVATDDRMSYSRNRLALQWDICYEDGITDKSHV